MASIKASVNRYAALETGSLTALVQLRGVSAEGEDVTVQLEDERGEELR
jgi:hypothetical protein